MNEILKIALYKQDLFKRNSNTGRTVSAQQFAAIISDKKIKVCNMLLVASTDCDKGSDTAYRGGKVVLCRYGRANRKVFRPTLYWIKILWQFFARNRLKNDFPNQPWSNDNDVSHKVRNKSTFFIVWPIRAKHLEQYYS